MAISDYYKSLDDKAKKTFRDEVYKKSGMSYATFYYKIRNNNWTKLESKLIEAIIESISNA